MCGICVLAKNSFQTTWTRFDKVHKVISRCIHATRLNWDQQVAQGGHSKLRSVEELNSFVRKHQPRRMVPSLKATHTHRSPCARSQYVTGRVGHAQEQPLPARDRAEDVCYSTGKSLVGIDRYMYMCTCVAPIYPHICHLPSHSWGQPTGTYLHVHVQEWLPP